MIIFVKILDSNDNKTLVQTCKEFPQIHNSGNKRPTIGSIIIYEDYKFKDDIDNEYKTEFFSLRFLHQMTHILGFNRNTLKNKINFQTKDNQRIKGQNFNFEIIKCKTENCKLMQFAKKYFNCPSLDYLELEERYQYSECRNLIHWESRILLGDYMTERIYIQDQVISEFTLYLLEETGFYKVYNYTGGLMRFGKNTNCSFFEKDCNVLKDQSEISNPNQTTLRNPLFKNEFCSGSSKTTCSPGRQSRGICVNNIESTYMDVLKYKRIDWRDYGDQYADFCPISISEGELLTITIEAPLYSYLGNCKIGRKDNYGDKAFDYWLKDHDLNKYTYSIFSDNYGEEFSDTSFCAFSSVIHKSDPNKFYRNFIRPTCYQMNCSDLSLTIKINEQYIVCPRRGGYIKIGGNYEGHILCPDYNLICSQTFLCNNMFDCVEKESRMKENYIYDYIPFNVSSQIIEITEPFENYENGYELSENDGICPVNCSECYENKRCFNCRNNIYLGERENDNNPIICPNKKPDNKYYEKNTTHYFKCIDNCLKCFNPNECNQCEPEYSLDRKKQCIQRIEGCKKYKNESLESNCTDNGNGECYKECEECDNVGGYFCIDEDKTSCKKIDNTSYFLNDYGCQTKCETHDLNCYKCNKTQCNQCKTSFYLNNNNNCMKGIEHCETHNRQSSEPICIKCEGNYRCLNKDQSKCVLIDNIDSYFYVDNNRDDNDCMDKCVNRYDKRCKNCSNETCLECEGNYFVYNKSDCIEKLEHCINHFYNKITKYCLECEKDYYCINNNKSICAHISEENKKTYYKVDNSDEQSCLKKCFEAIPYCEICNNKEKCDECKKNTNLTVEGKCILPPIVEGECLVKMHDLNDDMKYINLGLFPYNYAENFPNNKVIDHYINKDYTITVFIHSECTEELLNKGYFKINSKELQESIIDEFNSNPNLTYSVFITHNYKSHFRYYDENLTYLNISEKTNSAKNKEFIITNKFTTVIDETLGSIIANLIESEKINIFERESDVFNDYCQNVTLLGIDMPLQQRLLLLYTHKYAKRMSCLGEDCEVEEYNYEDSTCTCKCKIGNKLQDIFNDDKFEHYDGPIEEYNNFIDSIGIIKCTGSGFKNIKGNVGFFLIIIGIIVQVVLFILYVLCSEPFTKLPKNLSNPPKKNNIMIFSDWVKTLTKRNQAEGEVFIQPRDDDNEQLFEEEKSYTNDNGILSDISIDTNVGGMNYNKLNKNYNEKPNKKILILLNNKEKKKSKLQKDYEEIKSDSDIISLKNDKADLSKKTFCSIYWSVVSLKQHIINFISFIRFLGITRSYIPLSLQIIRSIFIFFLSFVLNILFLNQTYYTTKFNHFNEKYKFIHAENADFEVPTGERVNYAIGHTFGYAMIVFILLIIVNFIIGYFFFNLRNTVNEMKNIDASEREELIKTQKIKNMSFCLINIVLMLIFFFTITAFVGAYGGGFVDYFTSGIISIIFLELFPLLWSLVIASLFYFGSRGNNELYLKIANFFMF